MNRLRSLLAVLLLVVCPSVSLAKLQSGNFHVNLTLQASSYTNNTCRTLGLYTNGFVSSSMGKIRDLQGGHSVRLVLKLFKVACANVELEKDCNNVDKIDSVFTLVATNTQDVNSSEGILPFSFREEDTKYVSQPTTQPTKLPSTTSAPTENVTETSNGTASARPKVSFNTKRDIHLFARGDPIPGQTKGQKPTVKLFNATEDAVYLVKLHAEVPSEKTKKSKVNYTITISLDLQMENSYGYLSAIDYPALITYGVLTAVYGIYGVVWLILMACSYKDLVRLQFWIGAVIILGFLEKTFFVSEYTSVNIGENPKGLILVAEFVSAVKRALAWMLLIIVSLGFGTVKPRLGDSLSKVLAAGLVYFLFAFVDGIVRERSDTSSNDTSSMVTMALLLLFDVIIFYWIFSSLVATRRALRLRKNYVKLSLYNHFTYTLIFAIIATLGFLLWLLIAIRFPRNNCVTDWKELWLSDCYWHMLFVFVLGIIMILWRPSSNRIRFAYSLVNEEDDEEEEPEQENKNFETLKMRTVTKPGSEVPVTSSQAEDDLRWVEENLPTTAVDKALPFVLDSDEEVMTTRFELSKMN